MFEVLNNDLAWRNLTAFQNYVKKLNTMQKCENITKVEKKQLGQNFVKLKEHIAYQKFINILIEFRFLDQL